MCEEHVRVSFTARQNITSTSNESKYSSNNFTGYVLNRIQGLDLSHSVTVINIELLQVISLSFTYKSNKLHKYRGDIVTKSMHWLTLFPYISSSLSPHMIKFHIIWYILVLWIFFFPHGIQKCDTFPLLSANYFLSYLKDPGKVNIVNLTKLDPPELIKIHWED